MNDKPAVARLEQIDHRYGQQVAIAAVSLAIPAGCITGFIGPDGVGKSTLLGLIAGARALQSGSLTVLGGDMASARHRRCVCPRIAYMPQGLGKNLYPTLSVYENVDFFGRLFGHSLKERQQRIADVLASTGLAPFRDRPAGKLSGGMKQKLGLCCALIHDPDLLILDEPTTGVDPLSRRQFWQLIARIRANNPAMSIVVATAYMEEATEFDLLVAMDDGKVLATGAPDELKARTDTASMEEAFIALLPEEKRRRHQQLKIPPRTQGEHPVAIEAVDLTCKFGAFTAVDKVTLAVEQGEIFGFLGSNGCGKTTTMKMLTGLLPPTEGEAFLFGEKVRGGNLATRRRVGYMSQSFSLYSELSVRQNLELHARLFNVHGDDTPARVNEVIARFELQHLEDALPDNLPLGIRQRLSLAVAVIHKPEMLILDEPTSGVDPVARDLFWQLLLDLSRNDKVTIFISTHFMNEAERCDRISLMHAGRILATDSPAGIVQSRHQETLEDAFIDLLEEAVGAAPETAEPTTAPSKRAPSKPSLSAARKAPAFSWQRLFTYAWRESLELKRDPIRLALALFGTLVLMIIMGYGISMDVEDLHYAVLDRDQSGASHEYALNLAGSRYFIEQPPLRDYVEMDNRIRNGELSFAIEIPEGFGRDLRRSLTGGKAPEIGAWIDGAMPQRAETVKGYLQGMHSHYLSDQMTRKLGVEATSPVTIQTRFRYNPDVRSLVAMVPAVIPLLLIFIPSMLTALGVVREKEFGSIINLYVTPITKVEFIIAKQLPYMALAMVNFFLLVVLSVTVFQVPIKGSLLTLSAAAALYVTAATGLGLLTSIFTRSQIAGMFATALLTILPAIQFAGLLHPVAALEGMSAVISQVYPTTHFLIICRGIYAKDLAFSELYPAYLSLAAILPLLLAVSVALLKKQGR